MSTSTPPTQHHHHPPPSQPQPPQPPPPQNTTTHHQKCTQGQQRQPAASPIKSSMEDVLKCKLREIRKASDLKAFDLAVLSDFVYIYTEHLPKDGTQVKIPDFCKGLRKVAAAATRPAGCNLTEENLAFSYLVGSNMRYGGISIENPVTNVSHIPIDKGEPAAPVQFSAATFVLPDSTRVVAFRGTDSSAAGWKEDAYLAFEDDSPIQKEALIYLQSVMSKHKDCKFVVTGHSKGGHLAIYSFLSVVNMLLGQSAGSGSSVSAAFNVTDLFHLVGRRYAVVNFDGPGLCDETARRLRPGLCAARRYIGTFAPKDSFVGVLLNGKKTARKIHFVDSVAPCTSQHSVSTWCVVGHLFFKNSDQSKLSMTVERIVSRALAGFSSRDIKCLVDALFRILTKSNGRIFGFDEIRGCIVNLLRMNPRWLDKSKRLAQRFTEVAHEEFYNEWLKSKLDMTMFMLASVFYVAKNLLLRDTRDITEFIADPKGKVVTEIMRKLSWSPFKL